MALKDKDEAMVIFELYQLKIVRHIPDLFEILNTVTNKISSANKNESKNIDEMENVITYADFKEIVKQTNDFKTSFQSVMFSAKIAISSREEMLEFLENLMNAGFYEIGLNYLESAENVYFGDLRFEKIIKKYANENKNRK